MCFSLMEADEEFHNKETMTISQKHSFQICPREVPFQVVVVSQDQSEDVL